MKRTGFLSAGAAALIAPPALAQTPPAPLRSQVKRLGHALVLSGGGARGAYQAGVIAGIAEANGFRDGERFAPFDVVIGTSIGAINGWFVATGQYTLLRRLWETIGSQGVFAPKPRYAAILRQTSGAGTRLVKLLTLMQKLLSTEKGILDGERVEAFLTQSIDPRHDVLVPFGFVAADLVRQQGRIFYRTPAGFVPRDRETTLTAVRLAAGGNMVTSEVRDPSQLVTALRASAALPVLFDPVEIADEQGAVHYYVDGGVSDNTPIDVARALAVNVAAILVDPPLDTSRSAQRNAVEIAADSFGLMQARILEASLRSAYLTTLSKRAVTPLSPEDIARLSPDGQRAYQRQLTFLNGVIDAETSIIRPSVAPKADVPDFNRQDLIDDSFEQGRRDGVKGFVPYVPDI